MAPVRFTTTASALLAGLALATAVQAFPQGPRAAKWEALWKSSGVGGTTSVRDLPANGARPVAVHLPEGFDPAKPARLLTYFHGHGGDIGGTLVSGKVLARIKWLGASETQTVIACVEAADKPFGYWMTPPRESFSNLMRQVLEEANRVAGRELVIRSRVVSAHSGGGLALRNAVTAGQFAADGLEFLDCNYGDWGMVIAQWANKQTPRTPITTWNTPGPTRQHDAEIKARFPAFVTTNESPFGHFDIPGKLLGATLVD